MSAELAQINAIDLSTKEGLYGMRFQIDGTGPVVMYGVDGETFPLEDQWGVSGGEGFWLGLVKHPDPQDIAEYGVGAGRIFVIAGQDPRVKNMYGCDSTWESVRVTAHNMRETGIADDRHVELYHAKVDEFVQILREKEAKVDIIYFCLPQVPETNPLSARQESDYYDPKQYPRFLKSGLGLVYESLDKSRSLLKDANSRIITVMNGRIGAQEKQEVFEATGFEGKFLLTVWVNQDPATSLESYMGMDGVQLYEQGEDGEMVPIEVDEAVVRQKAKQGKRANIWHTIEVWELKVA